MVRAEVPLGGPTGASARSHSGRWFDIRRWAILGQPQAFPPTFPLWLERKRPHPLGRFRSLLSLEDGRWFD